MPSGFDSDMPKPLDFYQHENVNFSLNAFDRSGSGLEKSEGFEGELSFVKGINSKLTREPTISNARLLESYWNFSLKSRRCLNHDIT